MADLEYTVTNQGISTSKTSRLVSGTIGVYTVKFTFNNVWDGLEKWATFDPIPGTPYKQPLDANGECTIPGEVMGGVYLRIGVFGLAEGQAYPTIWASKLPLEEGCFVNVPPSDWPEPSPLLEDVVKVSEQTFTDAQKTQARTNIGAAGSAEMTTALAGKVDKPEDATPGNVAVIDTNRNISDSGKSLADIYDSAMISKTVSGAIVTIEDGADDVPVKSMTVQINPVQAGSGDPSPSNVRAISGCTQANIVRTGQNLFENGHFTRGLKPATIGTAIDAITTSNRYAYSQRIPVDQDLMVIVQSRDANVGNNMMFRGYKNGVLTWSPTNASISDLASHSVSVPSSIVDTLVLNYGTVNSQTVAPATFPGTIYVGTGTEYVAYNGTTYPITFPTEAGTVYGGSLTVREDGTGTLTVDRGYVTADATYLHRENDNLYTARNVPNISYTGSSSTIGLLCNKFKLGTGNIADNRFYQYHDMLYFRCATACASVADFITAYGDVNAVYPLANPVTYTFTAPQVRTLLGLNNIWADTGSIESLTYHADPTIATEEQAKAIKQSIAYVQDDFTAVQPYLVNDLVYVGDTLYIVTSQIAQGATMTPNTNITATTLNAVIKSLR